MSDDDHVHYGGGEGCGSDGGGSNRHQDKEGIYRDKNIGLKKIK